MPETRSPERICLFGGTFDPIHIGHLRVANEALKAFALTKMLFVPAGHPPHKQALHVTPFEDRFRMVHIACSAYPCFIASRLEASEDQSFTIETLERFEKEIQPVDQLFFLIGADAFADITSWKRWQELLAKVQFIVVSRPGMEYSVPEGARIIRLDGLEIPVSSSTVREQLERGLSPAEVPVEVREYIEQRGLYGKDKNKSTIASL